MLLCAHISRHHHRGRRRFIPKYERKYYSRGLLQCGPRTRRHVHFPRPAKNRKKFFCRNAVRQLARRPAEDRPPIGGVPSAVGAWNLVGVFEKIRAHETEMRQGTSRVGESYLRYLPCLTIIITNSFHRISAIDYVIIIVRLFMSSVAKRELRRVRVIMQRYRL